jgi:Secretion system C-terminal sorting domain/PKD domain
MKKYFTFFLVVFFHGFLKSQTLDVLFIGSSYTSYNNMPQMLTDIATSKADTIYFETNEPLGTDFEFFATDTAVHNKIYSRQWDYVVLQERSILPALDTLSVQENVYPFAEKLDSIILANNNCTETIFFMTWGKENGDSLFCTNYPPVCTYEGMQQRLRESYLQMAENNHGTVSPVGEAWKKVRALFPAIELYNPDESRPSVHGSYLAACVFYASLFHKSPIGAIYPSVITPDDALSIQTISSETVLDSLFLWQGTGNIANPDFSFEIYDNQVQFTNLSFNATDFFWTFGDDLVSDEENPLHIYSNYDNYNVTLTASNECSTFKTKDTFSLIVNGLNNSINLVGGTEIYPNPNNGNFTMSKNIEESILIKIFNSKGQSIFETSLQNATDKGVEINNLPKGMYHLILFKKSAKVDGVNFIVK